MHDARLLDANINRSAEGLRVLEDIARFRLNNRELSAELRSIRHGVRALFSGRDNLLLECRDAASDVGQITSLKEGADTRGNVKDLVLSNSKRAQEALRVIEEMLKGLGEYNRGKEAERLRFQSYSLEKQLFAHFAKRLPEGIYGILGEKFSLGRTNVEVAKEMIAAGIDVLQYREKLTTKSIKEIYEECLEIRKITADGGVPFIVNDHAAVAMMVGADGIHQGQDDLPISELRKIAPDMMLGCSTHSPAQAQKAIEDGADYIGVGPIFTTQTKDDVCDAVGFEYLEHVVANHSIDFVAIGGIKRDNITEVVKRGAKTVCLVTEIIGAEDIKSRIQEIKEIVGMSK